MIGKVRCPVASTAASAPTAPKRARSDTIISVRRGKRSASAPPISTVVSIASAWQTRTIAEPAGAGERERPPAERRQEGSVADQRHGLRRPDEPELAAAKREEGAEAGSRQHGLRHGPKLSFERGRPNPRRVRPDDEPRRQGGEPRARQSGSSRAPPRPAPTWSCCPEKWDAIGDHDAAARGGRAARRRRAVEAMRGWARAHGITLVGGSISERREGREKLSNTCVVCRPRGRDRGRLPQDPPLRRRGRRLRLPRVRRRGARRRAGGHGDRGLAGRAHGLLRRPLPGALPRSSRSKARSSSPCPAHFTLYTGKDHWELLLRARAVENQCYVAAATQIGETLPGRQSFGRALDRRSLGHRARAGAGRGDGDLGRARPRAAGGDPRALPVAREPPPGGLPLAVDGVTPLRAVLFDVDFTLCRPGPELGPEGYAALGREYGLELDPARYDEARLAAIEDLRQHPELDHDEAIWVRFTEDIVRGMGGGGSAVRRRDRGQDRAPLGGGGAVRALRRRAAGARRAAAQRAPPRA